jgi:hypothetical protein
VCRGSWLMEVFGLPNINIYKIHAKLQAADIGTKRITCLNTWRSNCVLINLIEPGVSPTGQRALLSVMRRRAEDTGVVTFGVVHRLYNRCARGSFQKSKFQKKKCVETNKVVYDDPATRACLCCEDYDADREPDYPCED